MGVSCASNAGTMEKCSKTIASCFCVAQLLTASRYGTIGMTRGDTACVCAAGAHVFLWVGEGVRRPTFVCAARASADARLHG